MRATGRRCGATVRLARERGRRLRPPVVPDRAGFGRTRMTLSPRSRASRRRAGLRPCRDRAATKGSCSRASSRTAASITRPPLGGGDRARLRRGGARRLSGARPRTSPARAPRRAASLGMHARRKGFADRGYNATARSSRGGRRCPRRDAGAGAVQDALDRVGTGPRSPSTHRDSHRRRGTSASTATPPGAGANAAPSAGARGGRFALARWPPPAPPDV